MNFACLSDLVRQYQYDEIRIIGQDIRMMGKPAHVVAMMRREDQLELCLLVQEEPKTGQMYQGNQVNQQKKTPGMQTNRELMKLYGSIRIRNEASMQQLEIGGTVYQASGSSLGAIHTNDLGGLYLLEKLTDAGWKLHEDHMFFRQDWEEHPMQLMNCRFFCPSAGLPDLDPHRLMMKITWAPYPVWHLIEQPVLLEIGDAAKDTRTELAFSYLEQDQTMQEGVCYINRVLLQDMWETEEQRFMDPQYQKQMLAHVSQEEFEAMKQQSLEQLAQICPRGMCFPVVEYECTQEVGLEFYSQDYLNTPPVCRSTSTIYLTEQKQETGKHGLRLRSRLIQSPVPPDTKQIAAELFRAVQTVPERIEEINGC